MSAPAIGRPAMRWQVPLFGVGLGLILSNAGFSDYGELHAMFTFADLRMLLVFAFAVAIVAIGARLFGAVRILPARRLNRSVIVGSLLFGLGWALCGVCPGSAFVQLGEGKLYALVSLGGIFGGTLLYGKVNARWLQWSRGSCG